MEQNSVNEKEETDLNNTNSIQSTEVGINDQVSKDISANNYEFTNYYLV